MQDPIKSVHVLPVMSSPGGHHLPVNAGPWAKMTGQRVREPLALPRGCVTQ